MKSTTVHSLITARALYDSASQMAQSGDRHLCTAGLIQLQDAVELVLVAMLREIGADERVPIENLTFDQMIGQMHKEKVRIPKSGTLKALNRQRVIAKHFGELVEPASVGHYLDACDVAMQAVVQRVTGLEFRDALLAELLADGEAKRFLIEATRLIAASENAQALLCIRKALFVEVEQDYAIDKWNVDPKEPFSLAAFLRGGLKAPHWKRNREWIDKNVKTPVDYVQIDPESLRLDCLEWGVSLAEVENVRRLTPAVFLGSDKAWYHDLVSEDGVKQERIKRDAQYCLDRTVSLLARKQASKRTSRWPAEGTPQTDLKDRLDEPLFERATSNSAILHRISEGFVYFKWAASTGFHANEIYWRVTGYGPDWALVSGFLLVERGNS